MKRGYTPLVCTNADPLIPIHATLRHSIRDTLVPRNATLCRSSSKSDQQRSKTPRDRNSSLVFRPEYTAFSCSRHDPHLMNPSRAMTACLWGRKVSVVDPLAIMHRHLVRGEKEDIEAHITATIFRSHQKAQRCRHQIVA